MNIINIGDEDVVRLNGSLMKGSQFKIIYQKAQEAVNKKLADNEEGDNYLERINFFTKKIDLENFKFTVISKKFEYLKPNGEGWKQGIVKMTAQIQFQIIKLNDVDIDNNLEKSENEPKILTFDREDIINLGNNNLIEGSSFCSNVYEYFEMLSYYFTNDYISTRDRYRGGKYINIEIHYDFDNKANAEAKAEYVIDFLRVNGTAWEKARILEIYITLNIDNYEDVITEYESPLDDIRKMIKNGEINCD